MTSRRDHLDTRAIVLLLGCCLFWGFQQVLVKATLPEVPPLLQAALRFVGASVLLWLWCRRRGVALFVGDGSLWLGLTAGALFCGEFVCIYLGLQHISASRLTVFLYTAPFWVAGVLPLRVVSERLRGPQWCGLALAFAAVVYAVSGGLTVRHDDALWWLGDALALASGALWGLTTVLIRSTRLVGIGAERLLFYQVALSGLVLPFVSLALGESWSLAFSGFAWTSIVVQTVLGAFLSYLVWMWLLGHYPATQLSVFVFLTPIFALLFGALWLGEAITPDLVAALVGVSLGIVLVNRQPAVRVANKS